MTINPDQVPGGDATTPGGSSTETDGEQQFVTREAYEKAVQQAKNRGERLRATEEELSQLRSKIEKFETDSGKASGDFKKLYEDSRTRAVELEKQLSTALNDVKSFKEQETNRRKYIATTKALGGQVDHEVFTSLFDASEIAIDDDGDIDQMSVTRYVEKIRKKYRPEVFTVAGSAGMPSTRPGGKASPQISGSEYRKLGSSEKMREWAAKEKEFPGTIDWSK